MYILNQSQTQIINSEFVERFCVLEKTDAVLILLSYGDERSPVTLARYKDMKEAKEILYDIMLAMSGGQRYYVMQDSRLYAEEHIKKDARVKRKGGS